jgi:hypothetical protein
MALQARAAPGGAPEAHTAGSEVRLLGVTVGALCVVDAGDAAVIRLGWLTLPAM